ncbi:hypothetical protein SCLCIDRAFT_11272 [Scleroderma citrinum Foug A]|uniref:F-box domain-containing protein n=1 Tax=Scleroderma citrinum Foug A TaxID=1036808 RepID=A0A0C2ZPL8_9AGAM|nr:hypothetical protein SCLCIDRAFT_11272 [Scleroderma citrinum Foug A]
MTPNLSRVSHSPNCNDISVTSKEAFSEQAAGGIDEVTRVDPSTPPEHTSLYRLPPELLAAIFLECMRQYGSSSYSRSVPPWVNVSYVCQYWRSVALNYAKLWTHIVFVSSEWMDELLRRSKTAPLIIHTDFYHSESDTKKIRSLEKALGHMERIQDLWIDFNNSKDVLNMIHARLTAAAPLLRSLHLSTCGENRIIIRKDTLPRAGLRRLHLDLCHVDWSSPIFNGLTELSLSYVVNNATECWDGLLLLLGQLPLLRQLRVDNMLSADITFEESFINTRNRTMVSLCRLEKLTLTDPIPWVTALLARLEFPGSTIVRVKCNYDNSVDISTFVPFMEGRFGSHLSLPKSTPSPPSPLRSLGFYNVSWENWKVMCGTSNPTNINISLEQHDLESQFLLQIEMEMEEEIPLDETIALLRALPVTHLNAIALYSDPEVTISDRNLWMEVFWDAPELWIIEVGYGYANMFIHALQPRDGVIFASTLTDIRFKGIEFNQRKCRGEESHDDGTGCLQCLCNALASRVEAGIVLQELFLDNCPGILARDITKLSKIVGRVEWDTRFIVGT